MSSDWIKPSQSHSWVPPSLSRQSLVRVVNHTLLLIPGVPRLSTNVRSVSQTMTHALLSSTEYFSTRSRARSKPHTTPNTGCVKFLYKSEIQWLKPSKTHFFNFYHYRVFLFYSWYGGDKIIYDWKISTFSPHRRTFWASLTSRNDPGTVTIPQHQFNNKTKQHTLVRAVNQVLGHY